MTECVRWLTYLLTRCAHDSRSLSTTDVVDTKDGSSRLQFPELAYEHGTKIREPAEYSHLRTARWL